MSTNTDPLLTPTNLLNFKDIGLSELIKSRGWLDMSEFDRIGAIYDFVRNEIAFGYNRSDDIRASEVLSDGFGQCNTKGTLLMALLRGVGIRCRLHGFTIHKGLQRGVVPELMYPIAPQEILHSWVEIEFNGRWINLEGFILDEAFLSVLQTSFAKTSSLCGYGAGTDCLKTPPVTWQGQDTYIQKTGIVQDFGVFNDPDAFYASHRQDFGLLQRFLYQIVVRHWMNLRVQALRSGRLKTQVSATHSHSYETETT